MGELTVDRADVIAFRFARHQLDRAAESAQPTAVDLLDVGVQDTGTDGTAWALAIRGARAAAADDLVMAWTIRGAPHAYRRRDVAAITVATAPLSETDAASRVFDASKPLRDHGIAVLDALTTVAREMREIVCKPMAKGDVSTALSARLDPPFLRFCRPCNTIHPYEQTFRLAALQAGLELEPGTSPPRLRRIPGMRPRPFHRLATGAEPHFDVIRGYLRFYGPATARAIATFLDAPARDVTANLPTDVVAVDVRDTKGLGTKGPATKGRGTKGRGTRYILGDDVDALTNAKDRATRDVVRLVGSHDPYVQLRDRELLVADPRRQKDLWRVIGRPGAILVDGEVAGTWRPRTSGKALTILVDAWAPTRRLPRAALEHEAERLADHRGVTLKAVADA